MLCFDITLAQEQGAVSPIVPPGDVQIVRGNGSTVVIISGVTPVDKNGRLAAPDDFAGQFRQAWENMRRLAAGAGSPLENIISVTVYTTEEKRQEEYMKLQAEIFKDGSPVTMFAVANKLRTPGALLEIHAVAILEERKIKR